MQRIGHVVRKSTKGDPTFGRGTMSALGTPRPARRCDAHCTVTSTASRRLDDRSDVARELPRNRMR